MCGYVYVCSIRDPCDRLGPRARARDPLAPLCPSQHTASHLTSPSSAPPSTLSVRIHSLALTSRVVFAVCVRTLIVGAIVGQRRHTLRYFPHRQDCTADDCGARWSRVFRGQGAFARPPFQRSWRCLFYPRTLLGPRRGRAQGGDANSRQGSCMGLVGQRKAAKVAAILPARQRSHGPGGAADQGARQPADCPARVRSDCVCLVHMW